MRQICWNEFGRLLGGVERTAFRLEQQPAYAMDYEAAHFAAFLAGSRRPPTEVPELAAWYDQISDLTGRGRRFERVRIHQDPPTDYQVWVRWIGRWNEEAGEMLHYVTPQRAVATGLLPDVGPDDWWLLDDAVLVRMRYDQPGIATLFLATDEEEVAEARRWREIALRAALD